MKSAEGNCCATFGGNVFMSDNRNLASEQVTGFVARFESQVTLLKSAVEEVRRASHSASGLERATRALLTDGGAIDFPSVPGVLARLSRNREMGALLTDSSGEILLANKCFYDLTSYNNSDSSVLQLYFERSGNLFLSKELPWQVVLSTGQFQTQRLALSDGSKGERLRWLQFCCQPLLSAAGGLEGVLTIVAEATEEIEIEDRVSRVVDLLAQQLTEVETPTSRLSALMARVRNLDDFLPRENTLSVENAAVEDTFTEDQIHYRQLLDHTLAAEEALKAEAREKTAADDATNHSVDILEDRISAEAASAIEAFENSFNIDLDEKSNAEIDATEQEQDIFASQTDFAPQQATVDLEEIDPISDEPAIDVAASYLPVDEDETQLWSEFSDFSADKMPGAAALGDEDEELGAEAQQVEEIKESEQELVEEQIEEHVQAPVQELNSDPEIIAENSQLETNALEREDEVLAAQVEIEAEKEKEEEEEGAAAEAEAATFVEPESNELSVTILEAPEQPALIARASAGKCALIVDDIPVNQKLLVLQLKRLNFATDIANNGQEALNRLAKFDYDIVFMDCDMPVMNGYDATIAIRKAEIESGRHIPIVAMTAYDRDADKERCLAAGMDDYLTKGVNASSLSRVIERCCDQAKKDEGEFGLDNSETEPFDAVSMANNYGKEELNEVVRLFLTSMETFVGSMQKAIDSRDGALVTSLANSIKGPSATLGLQLITRVTNDILAYTESEDWPQVRLKYLKLKTVYLRSQEQLRKLCPDVFTEGAHLFG